MAEQKEGDSPFSETPEKSSGRGSSRVYTQFSLGRMMLMLTIVTAAAAPLAYLARGMRGSRQGVFVFILFCIAGPPAVLIVISTIYRVLEWWNGWRNR